MKKTTLALLVSLLTSVFVVAQEVQPTKNLIVMIPDGTAISVVSAARWVKDYRNEGTSLNIDPYLCGTVTTFSLNEPIGDSAPTTSTYMTGVPMRAGNVSIYPVVDPLNDIVTLNSDSTYQPLITLLEAVRIEQQKSVGMVVTCEFPHATPADCSSHAVKRQNYDAIAPQIAANNLSVMFGGGNQYISENILNHFDRTQTTYIKDDKQALLNYDGDRVWALFNPKAMSHDINRNENVEPSLAEMTKKALEVLSKNENGFFLMVEGSQVDWAAHANDPSGIITEFLAFDKAIGEVIDFAKKDGNTTVVILPDHATSGFSIGRNGAKKSNPPFLTKYDLFDAVSKVKRTAAGMEEILKQTNVSDFKSVFKEYSGFDLSDEDVDILSSSKNYILEDYTKVKSSKTMIKHITEIYNRNLPFGFTSGGHTGEEVFLAIYNPNGEQLTGNVRNTALHNYLYQISGLKTSLKEHTSQAFAKHTDVFAGLNYTVITKEGTTPKLVINQKKNKLELDAYSSMANYNGKIIDLPSVAVYVEENNTFYIPKNLKEITFDLVSSRKH